MGQGGLVDHLRLSTWVWLAVAGAVSVIVLVGMSRSRRRLKLPPGPPAWPIVGCLPFLPKGDPPEVMFAKIGAMYGELFLLAMGARTFVVVSSARMAMEFLKTHDHEFANRPTSIATEYISFNGQSLFSLPASDPFYQRMRRMFVMELLSPKRISASRDLRKEQMLKMMQALRQDLDANRSVNFTNSVSTMALSLSMCMIFGSQYPEKDVAEHVETLGVAFKEMTRLLGRSNLSDFFPSIRWLDIQGLEAKFKIHETQLRNSMVALIEMKRLEMSRWTSREIESGANDSDIMSKLLSLEGEEHLGDNQIVAIVFVLLLAGSDSVSKGIWKALEELLKHPQLYKRAVDEVDEVVGKTRLVEETDISNLPFIQNIVKETLRLYPPAQLLIPHRNYEPCEVAGFHIPANSSVFINLYAISRDPSFWDAPMEFYPDRFIDSKLTVLGNSFSYIPFGYGKRQCPGLNLGMLTVQYGLALCLQCINWRLPTGSAESGSYVTWWDSKDMIVDGEVRVDKHLLDIQ